MRRAGRLEPRTGSTEEAMGGLGRRAAEGAAWSATGRLGSQFLQFAAGLVLARLLLPSDFGLLAAVLVFTQFSQIFFELGMGAGLVQSRDLREEDLATVFWLNALGGVVFAGLMAAAGPAIAHFFGQPELASLAPLVALAFTVNVGVCHLALLQRAMMFKAIALSELAASLIGFMVSILLAVKGFGVESLALGPVVQNLVMSVLLWTLVAWRPKQFIVRESLPRIWRFSGGMLGFNIVNYWGRNADNLLIGKFAGATSLGYYNRAYNLMTLPVQQVSQVLGRVMLPSLATMQDDHPRAARAYRRTLRLVNWVTVPSLVGLAAVSPALVPALWGDRWLPMVPMLAVVCIGGVPQCMTTSVGWIYQSQNRTGTMFKMGSVSAVLGVAAMVAAVPWGAMGVAWAVLARAWILSVPTLYVACKVIDLSAFRVLGDNARTLISAAVMGGVVWALPLLVHIDRSSVPALGLQFGLGVFVYAGLTALLQRSLLSDVRHLMRPAA